MLRRDSTFVVFFTTLSLSQNTYVGSPFSIGMPKHRSLNRKCSIASRQTFKAMNSAEKVLVSTVCCRLLNHTIGAQLRNMTYPVCGCVIVVSLYWLHVTRPRKPSYQSSVLAAWAYAVASPLPHRDKSRENHFCSYRIHQNPPLVIVVTCR